MTIDRIVHLAAGSMILLGLALSAWLHPAWIWLAVFAGANLFQSGITNWCLLSHILKIAGVPEGTCGLGRSV